MLFCHNCGEKLNDGVNFCTKCGSKIDAFEEDTKRQEPPTEQQIFYKPVSDEKASSPNKSPARKRSKYKKRKPHALLAFISLLFGIVALFLVLFLTALVAFLFVIRIGWDGNFIIMLVAIAVFTLLAAPFEIVSCVLGKKYANSSAERFLGVATAGNIFGSVAVGINLLLLLVSFFAMCNML